MRISTVTQPLSAELRRVESAKKDKEVRSAKAPVADRSEFSPGAQRLSDTKAQHETIAASVSAQPDVRVDRIAEVKQKIESGYYDSEEFIDKLADKLMKEFGINNPV